MNYEYIMATHPKWYLKVYYKNQIYYGFYGMLCDLIGATENREDYELHEELVRRVNIAKGVGLKKDQIFEFMSILAWAIGEKKGNWAEKPVSQQFDIPRAVIDEKYEELRGIPETD
ncbi:MAG: hypothetical protein JSW41_00440 [Candidatus Aenigmatarchaeota archaeon]|nr:MAG: hypothetical protein JSW41_00440 [Candidatus Aenigmarchaeota archaeon]